MEKHEEEMIRTLIDRDPELRRYYEEHSSSRSELAALQHKHYLTPEEDLEKKRIQKVKLAAKTASWRSWGATAAPDRAGIRIAPTDRQVRASCAPMRVRDRAGVRSARRTHAPYHIGLGRERVRRAGARRRAVQRPRLQHREPDGRRDARSDGVAHHAGDARRRSGRWRRSTSSSTSWSASSR